MERWKNNKNKPLGLKWFHSSVKILGIYFSYNIKENHRAEWPDTYARVMSHDGRLFERES